MPKRNRNRAPKNDAPTALVEATPTEPVPAETYGETELLRDIADLNGDQEAARAATLEREHGDGQHDDIAHGDCPSCATAIELGLIDPPKAEPPTILSATELDEIEQAVQAEQVDEPRPAAESAPEDEASAAVAEALATLEQARDRAETTVEPTDESSATEPESVTLRVMNVVADLMAKRAAAQPVRAAFADGYHGPIRTKVVMPVEVAAAALADVVAVRAELVEKLNEAQGDGKTEVRATLRAFDRLVWWMRLIAREHDLTAPDGFFEMQLVEKVPAELARAFR